MSLNSIFTQPLVSPSITSQTKAIQRRPIQRKVRSDKLHDIKFPVSLQQREHFRFIASQLRLRETQSNSSLFMQRLSLNRTIPLQLEYTDTKRYMHIKIRQVDYETIKHLAIKHDMSIRKAVTLIMLDILRERGLNP